ncbi:hypothetical protein [Haladaptatus sp. NG-WS-4]
MPNRRPKTHVGTVVSVLFTLGFVPGVASAHEVGGSRFDAPLPLSLLFVGAGVTVALTAGWLAVTERTPPETTRRNVVARVPSSLAVPVRRGLRLFFFLGLVAAFVLGIVGRQVPAENFSTVFTWAVWFRGVALLAILFGTPWPTLSPWRTLYRGLVWLEGRTVALFERSLSVLSTWVAFGGFLVLIGVLENLTVVPQVPLLTTVVLAVYALVMVGGSVLFGPAWLNRADPLGVFYRLFGRVASVTVSRADDGGCEIAVRPPWRGCLVPVSNFPLVAFIVAAVYTVSFDGFTNTQMFQTVLFDTRTLLGTGPKTSVLLYGAGLVAFVGVFVLASWLVDRLGTETTDSRDARPSEATVDDGLSTDGVGDERLASGWYETARRFAPTVLPIAAAYEVAHNYPYVFRSVGQLVAIALAPVEPGVEPLTLLGWLSLPAFWASQVLLIVAGHVVAVVAAHYVAVERFETPSAARRGHAPFVVLMVGYTVLSLWIISQPVVR